MLEPSRVSWLMMSKYSSFPQQTRCKILDVTFLLKWRQMYSKPRVGGTSKDLIYKAFHTVTHLCPVLSLRSWLSCGFMWLVCVGAGINESLLVAFMSPISLFSICLSLSVSQAWIIPSALTRRHTHSDWALRQPVTHYLYLAGTPHIVANRTQGCNLLCALLLFFLPLSSALRASQIMAPPEIPPRHQKHCDWCDLE